MVCRRQRAALFPALLLPWLLGAIVALTSVEAQPRTPHALPQGPSAELETVERYSCTRASCRDPFRSWIEDDSAPEPQALCPQGQSQEALKRFDLSVLKLTGLVWGDLGPHALVQTPDRKSHMVTVGSILGQKCGQVVTITGKQLVLQELYQDHTGTRFHQERVLRLSTKAPRM